jgi:hypothetical protein
MIDDVAIRHGEELVCLDETTRGDERSNAVAEQHPLVPRLVGRRHCVGARRWRQLLDGLVEAAYPD